MTNIAMEAMAHRNRRFSQRTKPPFIRFFYSFHGYVSHNQMVNKKKETSMQPETDHGDDPMIHGLPPVISKLRGETKEKMARA